MGMDAIAILADIDHEFNLGDAAFPGETVGDVTPGYGLKTVGELHECVIQALRARGAVDEDAVWEKECKIIGEVLGKDPSMIRSEHRFVEDLGMD